MKKAICFLTCLVLATGIVSLSACDFESGADTSGGSSPGITADGDSDPAAETDKDGETEQEDLPKISPLAALDKIEVSKAFGDGGSFAMRAEGNTEYSHNFKWTSEVTETERFYSELGLKATLGDELGIRKTEAGGAELFGGGNAGLDIEYIGPKSDSEPYNKTFETGFKHDGDFIVYAGSDGEEHSVNISELIKKSGEVLTDKTVARIAEAVETVPENLKKGMTLRFSVEKLLELGFKAEIDQTDGLAVRIVADRGFFNGLLNDMLEEFLPEKWLGYIPRADFGYETTDFDIKLAFDKNGLFKEYAFSSDCKLTLSLEVRGLFLCESAIRLGGGMSVRAE